VRLRASFGRAPLRATVPVTASATLAKSNTVASTMMTAIRGTSLASMDTGWRATLPSQ